MANPYPGGGANDVQRQTINLAVLHHTVTAENATWKQLSDIGKTRTYAGHTHSYHYDPETKEETFIAYHFLVYKDGTYRRCLNDAAVGWHCGHWEKNTRSIGIACVGDYSNQDPTEAQIQTIANIIRPYDRAVNGKLNILGHKEISATACPGLILNHRQRIVDLVNIDPPPPPPVDPCAGLKTEIEKLNRELSTSRATIDTLNKKAAEDKAYIATVEGNLAQTKSSLNEQTKALETANNKLKKTEERVVALEASVAECKIEADKLASSLAVATQQIAEKNDQLAQYRVHQETLEADVARLTRKVKELEADSVGALTWQELFQLAIKKLYQGVKINE